jgi:5-methylcytosine-specific restriction endonuclease McrA
MTTAPPHYCPQPGCRRLVVGRGYCPTHARQRDQARGSRVARGYDGAWAAFSKRWLATFPWCGQRADGQLHLEHSRCVQRVERVRATVTDHIVALVDGGTTCDPKNSQSLCASCNSAKAAAARRRGIPT